MKFGYGLATVVVMALASNAQAATNTVSWGTGQPVAAKGQVSGSGSYTIDDVNYTIAGGMMFALPTGGGMNYSGLMPVPMGGTWKTTTVTGLPTGQYTVFATIYFKPKAGGATVSVSTPTAIVNVP